MTSARNPFTGRRYSRFVSPSVAAKITVWPSGVSAGANGCRRKRRAGRRGGMLTWSVGSAGRRSQPPAAAATRARRAAQGSAARRRDAGGDAGRAAAAVRRWRRRDPVERVRRTPSRSQKRSAGSFSSAFRTAAATWAARTCGGVATGGGRFGHDLRDDLPARWRPRAAAPRSASRTARSASEYTSLRAGDLLLRRRLLGTHVVRRAEAQPRLRHARRRPAALTASAMPKSATIARPSCSRMFSGLMSRWITPWRCA